MEALEVPAKENENRLRCRRCHLTIKADELDGGFCPECFEGDGRKNYDFEEIETEKTVRYRCEDCGALIDLG